jgi:hypothetical protein
MLVKMAVELLKSVSFPLSNEELAEVDRQTYEEAQDDLNDENVISEERALRFQRFEGNIQQNY